MGSDSIGVSMPEDVIRELEADHEREQRRTDRHVSRSEIVLRRYRLGLTVEEVLDDADVLFDNERERRHFVRGAIIDALE